MLHLTLLFQDTGVAASHEPHHIQPVSNWFQFKLQSAPQTHPFTLRYLAHPPHQLALQLHSHPSMHGKAPLHLHFQ